MASITDLPPELISTLPTYLSSLDDWYALIRTSRYFYSSCANTTARFAPVFQQRDGRPPLPPHPHMLLSGIARQIGDWAIQSKANENTLWDALHRGNVGLLDLGTLVARLSVQDVRALHRDKIEVVKPMAERIHRELRIQWTGEWERSIYKPGFQATPEVCIFNQIIYSELFHHQTDRRLGRDGDQHLPLSLIFKRKWIELCMSSPEAGTSTSVGPEGVQSGSSGEHAPGRPTDNEDVVEDSIHFQDLNCSKTWTSICASKLWFLKTRHHVCACSALDHQGIDSLSLAVPLYKCPLQRGHK